MHEPSCTKPRCQKKQSSKCRSLRRRILIKLCSVIMYACGYIERVKPACGNATKAPEYSPLSRLRVVPFSKSGYAKVQQLRPHGEWVHVPTSLLNNLRIVASCRPQLGPSRLHYGDGLTFKEWPPFRGSELRISSRMRAFIRFYHNTSPVTCCTCSALRM